MALRNKMRGGGTAIGALDDGNYNGPNNAPNQTSGPKSGMVVIPGPMGVNRHIGMGPSMGSNMGPAGPYGSHGGMGGHLGTMGGHMQGIFVECLEFVFDCWLSTTI
jgi:hypothetical protein